MKRKGENHRNIFTASAFMLILILVAITAITVLAAHTIVNLSPGITPNQIFQLNTNTSVDMTLNFSVSTAGAVITELNVTAPAGLLIANITPNASGWSCSQVSGTKFTCQNSSASTIGSGIHLLLETWLWATAEGTSLSFTLDSLDNASGTDQNTNYNLFVDGYAPMVTLTTPMGSSPSDSATRISNFDDTWWYNSTDTITSQTECTLTVNGTVYGYNGSVAQYAASYFYNDTLADGTYEWNISCQEPHHGHTNTTVSRTLAIDETQPSFTYNGLPPESTVYTPSFQINVSSYDTGAGPAAICNVTLTNSSDALVWFNDTVVTYNTGTNITLVMPDSEYGVYYYDINCSDGASPENHVQALDFNITYAPLPAPNVSWNMPMVDDVRMWSVFNFSVNVNDTAGVANVMIFNGSGYLSMQMTGGTATQGTWSLPVTLSEFAYGTNTVIVNATNVLGGYNDTETRDIIHDNRGPTFSLSSPADNYNTSDNDPGFDVYVYDDYAATMNCTLYLYNASGDIWGTASNTSVQNNTLTELDVVIPAEGTYTWNVTCYDRATSNVLGSLGTGNTSDTRTITYDNTGPLVYSWRWNESDDLVSDNTANNNMTIIVNASDALTGVMYITANLTELSGDISGADFQNLTYNSGTGLWQLKVTVTDSDTYDFELVNLTLNAYDYAGNRHQAGQDWNIIVLYNMTTPPMDNAICTQFATGTTDFSAETDFNSVDFTVVIDWRYSTVCQYYGPGADNAFHRAARINFSSINMSDDTTTAKLENLDDALTVSITPENTFGTTRVYLNSTYFAELDATATVALYDLPFDDEPDVVADADAAGVEVASITYVSYNKPGYGIVGNLTFNVAGFSGYNINDSTAPLITVNSPAPNTTKVQGPAPLINITANGTGTQISNITVQIDGGAPYHLDHMTCYNATGSEEMNCHFTPTVADGERTLTITAFDYGAGTYPGNWNTTTWKFTSDSTPPAVVANQSNVTGQIVGVNDHILFNVTVTDATNVSSVTVYNGANVVAMTNHTPTGYNLTTTPTALGCTSSGTCTVTFNATDYWGQSNTTAVTTFTVDAGPPSVTAVSVTNATNVSSGVAVNIQATAVDPGTVASVTANGQAMALLSGTTTSGTWSATLTAAQLSCTSEGSCLITINATDNLGNYNDTETTSYVIDDTNPAVTALSAVPSVVKSGSNIQIGAVVTDTSNVTSVTTNNSVALTKTASGWNVTTTPGALGCPATGTCTFGITATDMAGNTNSTETSTFTVDNAAPTVTFTYNSTNLAKSTTAVVLNVTAVDGVSVATVKANNASMTQQGATNVWSINKPPAYFNCGSSGSCVVTFTANDTAGNSDASTTTTITVDDTNPTVSGGSVTNATSVKTGTGVNVQVTVADTAGIASVSVASNTMYQLSGGNTSGVWYANLTGTQLGCGSEGTCTITFTAADILGNTNNTHTAAYIIDNSAPTNLTGFSASPGDTSATISATMNESARCTVIYSTNVSNLNSEANASTFASTMSVTLSSLSASTVYYYKVTNCWDQAGNSQNLNLGPFNFTTSAASTPSGGGGGGGGGLTVASYRVGEIVGTKSEWNMGRGDAVHFNHNAIEHRMKALSVGSNYVVLEIMSEPQELTLNIGESAEVDLDADAKPDIAVRLLDIVYRKALISVTSLVSPQRDKIELLPPAKPKPRVLEPAVEVAEDTAVAEAAPAEAPAPETAPAAEPTTAPTPETVSTDGGGNLFAAVAVIVAAAIFAVLLFVYLKKQKNRQ